MPDANRPAPPRWLSSAKMAMLLLLPLAALACAGGSPRSSAPLPPLTDVTRVEVRFVVAAKEGAPASPRRTITDSAQIARLVRFLNERRAGWRPTQHWWPWGGRRARIWAELESPGRRERYGFGPGDGLTAVTPDGDVMAIRPDTTGDEREFAKLLGIELFTVRLKPVSDTSRSPGRSR